MCERRLDNVVYRIGYAISRIASRQLVTHKHIKVNNKIINIPSYNIKVGDIITLENKMKKNINILNTLIINKKYIKNWLKWKEEIMGAECLRLPNINDIEDKINTQLIVEWYSR